MDSFGSKLLRLSFAEITFLAHPFSIVSCMNMFTVGDDVSLLKSLCNLFGLLINPRHLKNSFDKFFFIACLAFTEFRTCSGIMGAVYINNILRRILSFLLGRTLGITVLVRNILFIAFTHNSFAYFYILYMLIYMILRFVFNLLFIDDFNETLFRRKERYEIRQPQRCIL